MNHKELLAKYHKVYLSHLYAGYTAIVIAIYQEDTGTIGFISSLEEQIYVQERLFADIEKAFCHFLPNKTLEEQIYVQEQICTLQMEIVKALHIKQLTV